MPPLLQSSLRPEPYLPGTKVIARDVVISVTRGRGTSHAVKEKVTQTFQGEIAPRSSDILMGFNDDNNKPIFTPSIHKRTARDQLGFYWLEWKERTGVHRVLVHESEITPSPDP